MTSIRIEPLPGQESVWDYPRPPRLERSHSLIQVVYGGIALCRSRGTYRVLETSHPPVYYIPPGDIHMACFAPTDLHSFCEWKGQASYYTVQANGQTSENAAWYYPKPTAAFAEIAGYVAFYPSRMEACYVDDEQVRAQAGDFYGGWITDNIVGPFKGEPGTRGW